MWAAQSYFYISHRHHKQLNTSILDGFVAQFDLLVDVVNADMCVLFLLLQLKAIVHPKM